ncbi:MAG: hypothetical protein WCP12_07090 [bacterium]
MSEYQYYEWQTVDRLLTEAEQEAVRSCLLPNGSHKNSLAKYDNIR